MRDKKDELAEIEEAKEKIKDINLIEYFNTVIGILNSHNIDSQGFCEYIRAIVEHEGIEIEKIWKEVKNADEKKIRKMHNI